MSKKIVIYTKEREVIAKLIENGKDICQASAKCHADDKFDFYKGAKLAVDRLEREYEKNKQQITQKEVVKKFVNGEIDIYLHDQDIEEFVDILFKLGRYLENPKDLKLLLYKHIVRFGDRDAYIRYVGSTVKHFEISYFADFDRPSIAFEDVTKLSAE